jgi:hypothetical protein
LTIEQDLIISLHPVSSTLRKQSQEVVRNYVQEVKIGSSLRNKSDNVKNFLSFKSRRKDVMAEDCPIINITATTKINK